MENTKIIIEISHGILQSVRSTKEIEYILIDHDNISENGKLEILSSDSVISKRDISRIILENIDQKTVIDEGWEECIDKNILSALLDLTTCESYEEVLEDFEGYFIYEVLKESKNWEFEEG